MPDCIADYISKQFDQMDQNRRTLQNKWEENREYFLGISADQWKKREGEGWRSTTFPMAVHQKVMMATAIIIDVMLGGGKIPYMLKPSPWQRHMFLKLPPEQVLQTEADINEMADLIDQQLADCNADRQFMKNALSCALYGRTYSKLVVQEVTRSGFEPVQGNFEAAGIADMSRIQQGAMGWKRWETTYKSPGWVAVPVWDIFRDLETDNLSECSGIIHRQPTNNFWLRSRKGRPYYNDEKLQSAIDFNRTNQSKNASNMLANTDTENLTPVQREIIYRTNNRVIHEWWGRIPTNLVEEFEKEQATTGAIPQYTAPDDTGDEVECCAQVVDNEFTVRFLRTDPKIRPFCMADWENLSEELLCRGIADNSKEWANVLRGSVRCFEDNKKLSGNVILALKERLLKNVPKEITPGTKIYLSEECQDVRQAIQQVTIQDVGRSLIDLIEMADRKLDEDSMVPKIVQGLVESGSQTATEISLRQAQANKYFGLAIRNLDEGLIEQMIAKFLDYNMMDETVQSGKGNYIVQATGFSSFQNKLDRVTKIQQLLALLLSNPMLAQDVKFQGLVSEIAKALDIDPGMVWKSEEEKAAEAQMRAQMPPDPMVEAETEALKAKAEKDRAEAQHKLDKSQNDQVKAETGLAKVELAERREREKIAALKNAGTTERVSAG